VWVGWGWTKPSANGLDVRHHNGGNLPCVAVAAMDSIHSCVVAALCMLDLSCVVAALRVLDLSCVIDQSLCCARSVKKEVAGMLTVSILHLGAATSCLLGDRCCCGLAVELWAGRTDAGGQHHPLAVTLGSVSVCGVLACLNNWPCPAKLRLRL
jgi:hypothetical protein